MGHSCSKWAALVYNLPLDNRCFIWVFGLEFPEFGGEGCTWMVRVAQIKFVSSKSLLEGVLRTSIVSVIVLLVLNGSGVHNSDRQAFSINRARGDGAVASWFGLMDLCHFLVVVCDMGSNISCTAVRKSDCMAIEEFMPF